MIIACSAAEAATIRFTVEGDLALQSGTDILDFDGAHYTAIYDIDINTPASNSTTFATAWVATEYAPQDTLISIINRPGSALDLIITGSAYPSAAGRIGYDNSYGTLLDDRFRIQGDCYPACSPLPRTNLPTVVVDFGTTNFFAGTGSAPITFFDPDSYAVTIHPLTYTQPPATTSHIYDMVNASLTVSYVPVPAAFWLFVSGLLGLIGVSRRKQAA